MTDTSLEEMIYRNIHRSAADLDLAKREIADAQRLVVNKKAELVEYEARHDRALDFFELYYGYPYQHAGNAEPGRGDAR